MDARDVLVGPRSTRNPKSLDLRQDRGLLNITMQPGGFCVQPTVAGRRVGEWRGGNHLGQGSACFVDSERFLRVAHHTLELKNED